MKVIARTVPVLLLAIPLACGQNATGPTSAAEAPAASAENPSREARPSDAGPSLDLAGDAPLPPPAEAAPSLPAASSVDPPVKMVAQRPLLDAAVPAQGGAEGSRGHVLEHCVVSLIEEAQVPAEVPAIEGGKILELFVKEGQQVKKGDLLAQLDDVRAKLQRDAATARLQVAQEKAKSTIGVRYAKAAAKVAQAEYEVAVETNRRVPNTVPFVEVRKLLLTANRAVLEIEQAELQERVDDLDVNVSQAELDAANESIARYKILSPMDAVVRKVYRHRGEWVKPGEPVMHVVRIDRLRVEGFLNISEFHPSEIIGRPVTIQVPLARGQETTFQAQISFVDPEVQSGGDYPVWAEVENRQVNGQFVLMPGMSVTMTLHTEN